MEKSRWAADRRLIAGVRFKERSVPLNHLSQYSELTGQQFEAIGRIVVEWSNIEFQLGLLLSRLLFTPEFLSRAYTDEIMASRRQSALRKALQIHKHRYGDKVLSAADAQEVEAINRDIEALRGKRNRFSHFCWARSNDNEIFGTGFSGHVPGSARRDKDSMTITIGELEALYKSSYSLVDRLSSAVEKLPSVSEEQNLTSASTRPTAPPAQSAG